MTRRRKRLLWIVAILVAGRVLLAFGLGPLVRAAADAQGIALDFERLDLDLLAGRVELWRLQADVQAEGAEALPLFEAQTVAADLDVLALLRGRVRVRRVELDGARVELERDASGAWNFDRLIAGGADATSEEPEPYEPAPIALELPVEVIAARVQDLTVHLRDRSVEPPLDCTVTASLTAADVGSPDRTAHFDTVVTSPELVDLLRVRGGGVASGARAELALEVELAGLRLRPLAPLLLPLGLEPVAERIDGGLSLSVDVAHANEPGDRVAVALDLNGARLRHDGREALALDELAVRVAEAWPRGVNVAEVTVAGARLAAQRQEDGRPALAGVAWRGAPPSAAEHGATPSPRPPTADPGDAGFAWSVERVRFTDGRVSLDDRAVAPAVMTAVHLERLDIGPLTANPEVPLPIELTATIPGAAERLDVAGTLSPAGPELALTLGAEELNAGAFAPYLAAAGVEPALERGSLRLDRLSAGVEANGTTRLQLAGLALVDQADGGRELAALDALEVALPPNGRPAVELDGARLEVRRDAEGGVSLLGLRLGGADVEASELGGAPSGDAPDANDAPGTSGPAPAFVQPQLALPTANLTGVTLRLEDATGATAPVELGPVAVALQPAEASAPGSEAYSLTWNGVTPIASQLGASLRIEQAPAGPIRASGRTTARGLEVSALEPWLEPLGLAGALQAGEFEAQVDVSLAAEAGAPRIDAELGPVRLTDAGTDWLEVESVAVEGLLLGGDGPRAEAVRLVAPTVRVARDPDGGLRALGMRLLPADEGAQTVAPQELDLDVSVELTDLSAGPGAAPLALDARLVAAGAELGARGDLTLDPDDLRANLALRAERLAGERLAELLPEGLVLELTDGVAGARVNARIARAEEGGQNVSIALLDAELRERDATRPLAELTSMSLNAPRLDPRARVFDVDELSLTGARLDVTRRADGSFSALGMRVGGPTPEPGGAEAPESANPGDDADGESSPLPTPAGSASPPGSAGPVGAASASLRANLGRLDLDLAELNIFDETRPGADPTTLSLRAGLREPFELAFDPESDVEQLPPLGLELTGGVAPGVGSLELSLEATPFADRPGLKARLALRGLDGEGLLALAPGLDADGTALTDGRLDADLNAELSWRRRSPLDFDLRGGFGAEAQLTGLALRGSEDGEVALGVDSIEVQARRIAPDAGRIELSRIEIDTPRAHVRRTEQGLELAGLVLHLPDPPPATDAEVEREIEAPEAADEVAPEPAPSEPGDAVAAAGDLPPAVAEGAAPAELRIDDLIVHGLDVRYEDTTTNPPFVLPLSQLEADVRGFTTRAATEPTPIRVSAALGAAPVLLRKRSSGGSLVGGLVSLAGGGTEDAAPEERRFFQEVALSASLVLAPRPKGWIRFSLSALELTALEGLAREAGIDIGDGLLEVSAKAKLEGDEGVRVDSVSSFAYLSLSEPEGGPIRELLNLPAPLDTVLIALENERGEHRIPMNFRLGEDGSVSAAGLAAQASSTLLQVVTEALAAAPVRAVGGVTDTVGLGGLLGGEAQPKEAKTARLTFGPGGLSFDAEGRAELAELAAAAREDPMLSLVAAHSFGREDLARAERLAWPATREAAELLRGLRLRRTELVRERDALAVAARSQLLLGQADRYDETRAAWVAVERELGLTEDAVDRVAELLRPGADAYRERRVREAALAIADARMDALARLLLEAEVPFDHIDLRPPRFELAEGAADGGSIVVTTRGGTPPKGWFRTVLGWVGL